MGSTLPPDPYLALGVAKDASGGVIRTQYRKLVLKFHPDKVKDESQKAIAADEFHKIQTAYEIVGDEDRRGRYDAQVRLAELRRERVSRGDDSGPEVKTTAYKSPTEPRGASAYYSRGTERVSPTYEERRPAYANDDYFAQSPKTASRKDRDDIYERGARYETPREDHVRPRAAQKTAKDSERLSRKAKSTRADKDIKRERERKSRAEIVSDMSSDEDEYEYERAARRRDPVAQRRYEEEQRRVKDQYTAHAFRQTEEADRGNYSDERTRKMMSQHADAFNAIRSGGKRQEPATRQSSAKDHWKSAFAKVKESTTRPPLVSRESQRSQTADYPSRRPAGRDHERRASEDNIAESRKPSLNTTRSSPTDIRLPSEKPRSRSLQVDTDDLPEQPKMRRADTMPNRASPVRERDSRKSGYANAPQKSSGLRQAETPDVTASPGGYDTASPGPNTYYNYHHQYADDVEYPTPDGYKTEMRQPAKSKAHTRSPSPMREADRNAREISPDAREQRDSWESRDPHRERARAASAQYRPQMQTRPGSSRTTSYMYKPNVDSYSRPAPVRENSGRGSYLYGEMPRDVPHPTRSPKVPQSSRYSPPPPETEYRPATTPYRTRQAEETKPQLAYAYTRRPSEVRPSYTTRSSSSAQRPVFAR